MAALEDVREISRLAYGFMGSKALFSALNLDIFSRLAATSKGLVSFSNETGIAAHRLETLLTACVSLGLLVREGDKYRNAPASERYLVRTKPNYFGDYYRFQIDRQVYPMLESLDDGLAGQDVSGLYTGGFSDPAMADDFARGQHSGSLGPAYVLARTVDLHGATTLLDVGGGSGAFSITLCRRFPDLTAVIIDFPNMIDIARKHVGSAGLDNRISFASASAEASTWPAGVDAILMSYLFSAVGQTEVTQLIAKAFDALRPGGQLLVHDFVVDDDRSGPDLAALWNLVMVMGNPDAAFLTPGRLDTMLDRAGFVEIETKPLISDITSLTQARKPSPA